MIEIIVAVIICLLIIGIAYRFAKVQHISQASSGGIPIYQIDDGVMKPLGRAQYSAFELGVKLDETYKTLSQLSRKLSITVPQNLQVHYTNAQKSINKGKDILKMANGYYSYIYKLTKNSQEREFTTIPSSAPVISAMQTIIFKLNALVELTKTYLKKVSTKVTNDTKTIMIYHIGRGLNQLKRQTSELSELTAKVKSDDRALRAFPLK
jgi:hypothetical protein